MNNTLASLRAFLLLCTLTLTATVWAQGPNDSGTYYQAADGQKGQALKTALYKIIRDHKTISYDGLLDCYPTTDCRADGKLWDMYSNTTNYSFSNNSGTYKKEGDMFNREHSVPQSWFNKQSPMKSDLVHVVPTDGYVNNRRSNYPFGETDSPTYTSNNGFSKLGPCSVSGYTGTVFEPNDEYKGDFARIYFYMATCYENKIASWSSPVMAGNAYPAFKTWFINMLLRWSQEDPVSQKEIDRNNAVYKFQKNRNPYVDYPGLEQLVWGTKQDVAFDYDSDGTTIGPDPDPVTPVDPDPVDPVEPAEGTGTFRKVTTASDLVAGGYYLIVYEKASKAMSAYGEEIRTTASVTINDGTITTEVDADDKPSQLTLGSTTTSGVYTLYDAAAKTYLALTAEKNKLQSSTDGTLKTSQWKINVSSSSTSITSAKYTSRSILYNVSAPRFACYTSSSSSLAQVCLYRRDVTTGISTTPTASETVSVYSLSGTLLRNKAEQANALANLPAGLYIVRPTSGSAKVVRVD